MSGVSLANILHPASRLHLAIKLYVQVLNWDSEGYHLVSLPGSLVV